MSFHEDLVSNYSAVRRRLGVVRPAPRPFIMPPAPTEEPKPKPKRIRPHVEHEPRDLSALPDLWARGYGRNALCALLGIGARALVTEVRRLGLPDRGIEWQLAHLRRAVAWIESKGLKFDIHTIIRAICATSQIPSEDLLDSQKDGPITAIRQLAMAAARIYCPTTSTVVIGRVFGRDHSTVTHAHRKWRDYV